MNVLFPAIARYATATLFTLIAWAAQAQYELRGTVTQRELLDLYRHASVFALACRVVGDGDRDGIPNVLVEAMAVGLPVISTNVSGIPELIEHGVSGWLTPPKDVQALAAAIEELLNDAALRERLSRAAREQVCREFDAEVNVAALQQLFLDCLKAG